MWVPVLFLAQTGSLVDTAYRATQRSVSWGPQGPSAESLRFTAWGPGSVLGQGMETLGSKDHSLKAADFSYTFTVPEGFPDSSCNAGDPGLIPGSGRSPGEGRGYPLQYSGLENSMDCIVVDGVAKSLT